MKASGNLSFRLRMRLLTSTVIVVSAAASHARAAWVETATQPYQGTDATITDRVRTNEPIQVTVALKLQNRADLDRAIGRPGLLTKLPFKVTELDRFLPTAAQASAVVRYLVQSGFHNVHASANRLLITADGDAASVSRAFNTALVQVKRHGVTGFANLAAAQVPTELGNIVLSVLGLQTLEQMHTDRVFGTSPGPACPVPAAVTSDCSPPNPPNPPPPPSGLNPSVFQTAYNATLLPAANRTLVGIFADGNLAPAIADLHTFESAQGLPALSPTIVLAGAAGSDINNTVEWDIDSQTIQSVAGGTLGGLTFYVATTLTDPALTSAFNAALSANVAKVLNGSFGECETVAKSDGAAAADDQIFALALAQGQTFSFSSGDSGSAECGSAAGQSYPASSQYVIAIGGTTLTLSGGNYASETAWAGSGGGPSQIEPQPLWQQHVIPGTTRGVPDLAFDANPSTGILITFNGGPSGPWGGTSVASPIFVGLFARLQTASGNTSPFPAQWIYHFPAGKRATAFHDIISGSNGGYQAGVGWDFVTGFGSLNAAYVRHGIAATAIIPAVSYLLSN